jgi:hypothetical protein
MYHCESHTALYELGVYRPLHVLNIAHVQHAQLLVLVHKHSFRGTLLMHELAARRASGYNPYVLSISCIYHCTVHTAVKHIVYVQSSLVCTQRTASCALQLISSAVAPAPAHHVVVMAPTTRYAKCNYQCYDAH